MIFPICTIFMLIALCANTVSSQVVLTSVNLTDLQTMSAILSAIVQINPRNFWNMWCIQQTIFDSYSLANSSFQEKSLLLTLKSLNKTYPTFCANNTRKAIFSLFRLMHPDSAIRFGVCQTAITKVGNLNGYCDPTVWTDRVLRQIYSYYFTNYDTVYLCSSVSAIHESSVRSAQYGAPLDQFMLDLSNSQPCVNKQSYQVDPIPFTNSTMCKTASGKRSAICQFISDPSNTALLCQGFLALSGKLNLTMSNTPTSLINTWSPAFGTLASKSFFADMLAVAANDVYSMVSDVFSYYAYIDTPVSPDLSIPYELRDYLCGTDSFICPPVNATSCPQTVCRPTPFLWSFSFSGIYIDVTRNIL